MLLIFLDNSYILYQLYGPFKIISLQKHQTQSTTTTTVINYSTKAIDNNNTIVQQAYIIKNKIEDYFNGIIIVGGAILCGIATVSSFLVFIIKFYKNNCTFKVCNFIEKYIINVTYF